MKSLVWLILLAVLATAIAVLSNQNGGYVLIVLPPWRLSLSFNLLPVVLLLAFGLFYALLRTYALLCQLPGQAREYREHRQQLAAHQTLFDATRLLFEGRVAQALKKAAEAYKTGAPKGLSALVAARSAQRLRQTDQVQPWTERAIEDDKNSEAAALILQAETALGERDFAQAMRTLQKLDRKSGGHIAALRLELRAVQGNQDWANVLRLARQLEKRDAISPHHAEAIKQKAHIETLRHWKEDATALLRYLKGVPEIEKRAGLIEAAAQSLVKLEANEDAQKLLESLLDERHGSQWESSLVNLYGLLPGGDVTGRISRAERWLEKHPRDATLLLTLGRLCVKQKLWGKAQSYLEASLSQASRLETHLALAQLFEQQEKPDLAHQHYRASALLAGK